MIKVPVNNKKKSADEEEEEEEKEEEKEEEEEKEKEVKKKEKEKEKIKLPPKVLNLCSEEVKIYDESGSKVINRFPVYKNSEGKPQCAEIILKGKKHCGLLDRNVNIYSEQEYIGVKGLPKDVVTIPIILPHLHAKIALDYGYMGIIYVTDTTIDSIVRDKKDGHILGFRGLVLYKDEYGSCNIL